MAVRAGRHSQLFSIFSHTVPLCLIHGNMLLPFFVGIGGPALKCGVYVWVLFFFLIAAFILHLLLFIFLFAAERVPHQYVQNTKNHAYKNYYKKYHHRGVYKTIPCNTDRSYNLVWYGCIHAVSSYIRGGAVPYQFKVLSFYVLIGELPTLCPRFFIIQAALHFPPFYIFRRKLNAIYQLYRYCIFFNILIILVVLLCFMGVYCVLPFILTVLYFGYMEYGTFRRGLCVALTLRKFIITTGAYMCLRHSIAKCIADGV
ncbi:pC257L [African swine fever virus]|uniref:PC257L n=1 Tax=African swine fever virus TaxID=10497 RepID=A0A8A1UF03_ASF|nr:pC257L [African swine fever virus]